MLSLDKTPNIMRRLTTSQFIEKAKTVHGNVYGYKLVDYVNAKTKVKISCVDHGDFWQNPSNHLIGNKCPDCANFIISQNQRHDTRRFIEKARLVHGDLYDYDSVDYVTSHVKVKIRCHKHGEFTQKPSGHLVGRGCPDCGRSKKINTIEFIHKCRLVHGDLYDYSLVNYVNSDTKVKITCKRHSHFLQKPYHHLANIGCPDCGHNTHNRDEFIKRSKVIHGDLYRYDLVEYVGQTTKVKIYCVKHDGVFLQRAGDHLRGSGCNICGCGGGYSTSKPGTLYYVRFDLPEMTLYKVGITNRTVEKRFSDFKVKPVILRQWRWEDGEIAAREEKRILKGGLYDQYRYNGEPLLEDGNTECFKIDIMQLGNVTRVKRTAA